MNTDTDTDKQTAQTILAQLGGNHFATMTGAKNFTVTSNGLMFSLPGGRGYTTNGINRVCITLNGLDLYDVTYYRIRGVECKVVTESLDVYCDQLRGNFELTTGLYTSLGTLAG